MARVALTVIAVMNNAVSYEQRICLRGIYKEKRQWSSVYSLDLFIGESEILKEDLKLTRRADVTKL